MTDAERDHVWEQIKTVADNLGEVFDSVQIVVTHQDGDSTCMITAGSGSFHARWASIRELLMTWDETTKGGVRSTAFIDGMGEDPGE